LALSTKSPLACFAVCTALAARRKASEPSCISSARSLIFFAELVNAVLAAVAVLPLNLSGSPNSLALASSWIESRRSRLSACAHWLLALCRGAGSALAT
jgi:hypothetical protein